MIADLPLNVTVNGETHTGTKSTVRLDNDLVDEGLRAEYRFSLHIKRGEWLAEPVLDDLATIAGIEYRVLRVADSAADRKRRIDLGEKYAVD